MKKMKNVLLMGFVAFGVLAARCSKEEIISDGSSPSERKASMQISIKGEGASTSARAIGNPSSDDEKTVHTFTVYVFNNSTGVLEARETFTDGLEGQISGLGVASQKKVVVLVNQPQGFPSIISYDDFEKASTMIDLSTQVPKDFQTDGLFMSGETEDPITLSTEGIVSVPVTVRRLTSKVRLGSLTVAPDGGLSIDDFKLKGVSIQKARDKYDALGVVRSSGFNYVGGVQPAGSESLQVDYLNEFYSLPNGYSAGTKLNPEVYFYVFPNDNTNNNATLLNLYGNYKGKEIYFPFYINQQQGVGSSTTDGTWITRNKIYTLNVTLKKIGNSSENPNVPNEEVSMDVEVEVANWEAELIQEVEW